MPLFGSKPNKTFVLIYYRYEPPTSSKQAEILASLSKGGTPVVLAEVGPLPKERWGDPVPLRDAYMEMQCTKYLMQHRIGIGKKKLEYKTREMGGFLVTTMSGEFVEPTPSPSR